MQDRRLYRLREELARAVAVADRPPRWGADPVRGEPVAAAPEASRVVDRPAARRRRPGRRALGIVALAAALGSGCASGDGATKVFRHGAVGPGRYLSTVIVTPGGCSPGGGSCTVHREGTVEVTLPLDPDTASWVYEAYAHELCHVVAGLHRLVGPADPCHNEDGGRMRSSYPHHARRAR